MIRLLVECCWLQGFVLRVVCLYLVGIVVFVGLVGKCGGIDVDGGDCFVLYYFGIGGEDQVVLQWCGELVVVLNFFEKLFWLLVGVVENELYF